ncbi:MAG: hypothetical protein JST94_02690 [Bacteroidetes bacterium]|nr:hypothetical protein [Bacteroidota bacterium]MBS1670353.1 hypothetical protein [Bacteroidota bacterium]
MKKKLLLIATSFVFTVCIYAQPVQQKVSDKLTITFPGKPEEQKPAGDTGPAIYSYSKDSSTSYMAMSYDLSPMGLTADAVASMGDGLWDQMKTGMTAQLGGATITKDEKVNYKGVDAHFLEIDGTSSTAPQLKGKKAFVYVLFLGANLHQVAFYSVKKDAKIDDGKDFFDSAIIAK